MNGPAPCHPEPPEYRHRVPQDSDQPTEVFRYPPADQAKPRTRSPVVFVAITLAGLGIITWAWTGTWAWAVTGLVLMVLLAMIPSATWSQ